MDRRVRRRRRRSVVDAADVVAATSRGGGGPRRALLLDSVPDRIGDRRGGGSGAMITSKVEVEVVHRFAVGQLICSRGMPSDVWRVVGLDFERKYGGVYILEGVTEAPKMWIITHNPFMPVQEAASQSTRQYVSFVDAQFAPA
jgi:hypothetical protein